MVSLNEPSRTRSVNKFLGKACHLCLPSVILYLRPSFCSSTFYGQLQSFPVTWEPASVGHFLLHLPSPTSGPAWALSDLNSALCFCLFYLNTISPCLYDLLINLNSYCTQMSRLYLIFTPFTQCLLSIRICTKCEQDGLILR